MTFFVSQADRAELTLEIIETGEKVHGLEFAIIDAIENELAMFLATDKYGEP
ncbi:MAG: hypothetical protein HC923_12650 [Myxococcales bacterium]|nr:hypothetical protein [Myxococcales bacterium]